MKNNRLVLIFAAVVCTVTFPKFVIASEWAGGDASWSSNGSTGWNGTGVPNAVGAVANHWNNARSTTTVDGSYTVGTISQNNPTSTPRGWTITSGTASGSLTLDGVSGALISNSSTTAGAQNTLTLLGNQTTGTTLTLNLADNLAVSYTGSNSTATGGAIQFGFLSVISGTGNITLTNNNFNTANILNAIFFDRGVNTFTGNISVVKGSTVFTSNSSFGGVSTNVITLGAANSDDVSLMSSASVTLVNNWQTAAGSTGSLVLGAQATDSNAFFTGAGLLNSDLTLMSKTTTVGRFVSLEGVVSGTGGITTTGSGATRLTQANTYSGNTKVNSVTLQLDNNLALQNSAYDTSGTGVVTLKTGVGAVTTPTFGGLIGSKDMANAITSGYSAVTSLTLNPNTGKSYTYSGIIADGAAGMTLTKSGLGTQILTGANTYTGATIISVGTLLIQGDHSGGGLVTVESNGALGGGGGIASSLTLNAGANFVFSLTETFTVNGASVTFGGFSIADLIGLDSSVAAGTYALIDGSASFNYTNVSNFGSSNAADIGGGKSAYFEGAGLQVVVVPEPTTWALVTGALTVTLLIRRRRL